MLLSSALPLRAADEPTTAVVGLPKPGIAAELSICVVVLVSPSFVVRVCGPAMVDETEAGLDPEPELGGVHVLQEVILHVEMLR